MKKNFAFVCSALLLSGCSTITNGSSEQLSFSSREDGTKLYINGQFRGEDYANITVPRGKKHTIVAQKEGCESSTITTDYSFQWGKSLIANALIDFGILTIPTDLITGSAWKSDSSHYEITPNCPTASSEIAKN